MELCSENLDRTAVALRPKHPSVSKSGTIMSETLTISITQARAKWWPLLADLESGHLREIVITLRGKAVACMTAIRRPKIRHGVLNGKYCVPEDIDGDNEAMAEELERPGTIPQLGMSRNGSDLTAFHAGLGARRPRTCRAYVRQGVGNFAANPLSWPRLFGQRTGRSDWHRFGQSFGNS